MDEQLNLLSIKEGLPGMHKDLCSHYYSACMTTLHRAGHIVNGTILHLDGNRKGSIPLYWEDYFDETIDRSWKEINYCTDHAAVCMSCVLAIHETEFTIVERSCKGDGFDYWLGYKEDHLFNHAARLEISGILKESRTNTIEKRLKDKMKQTEQSDETCLPAYISIIEFGKPKALFIKSNLSTMDIRELHNEAMYKAELGDIQKYQGNSEYAIDLYAQAYELEKNAACIALEHHMGEPTISILLKSAASLAMRCSLNRDAEKLIGLALSGEPPRDIAEELRNMLETVNFHRHLDLRGVILQEDEVQLVIAGKGVGYGYAKSDDVLDRVDTFQKLAIRTIERKAGKSFRKAGKIPNELKDACQPFITVPSAASMAFRMKFGSVENITLSGFGTFENVIEDIMII